LTNALSEAHISRVTSSNDLPSSPLLRECRERGTLRVTGPDRVTWLNGLLSCDVGKASAGQAVLGLLLNRVGKIQSDVWVLDAGDSLLLSVAPGTAAHVLAELDQRLVMEDAELKDVSDHYVWTYLVGVAAAPPGEVPPGSVCGELHLLGELAGCALACPAAAALPPFARLDDDSWRLLRIRAGLGEFGVDFTSDDRPHEASLDRRAVAWNKGCYLGQEVVCMQDMRGKVKRALRTFFSVAPPGLNWSAAALLTPADKVVGSVRSAAFDSELGRWWLLADVGLEHVGAPLSVQVGNERYTLETPSPSD
jgi:tRNA-modifying protein YgfZ